MSLGYRGQTLWPPSQVGPGVWTVVTSRPWRVDCRLRLQTLTSVFVFYFEVEFHCASGWPQTSELIQPSHSSPTLRAGIPGLRHHVPHQSCTGDSLVGLSPWAILLAWLPASLCSFPLVSAGTCSPESLSVGLLPAWVKILSNITSPVRVSVAL